MPKQKKLKKRIRARMSETGERYTEARSKEFDETEDLVERVHRRIRLAWPRLDVWEVMLAVSDFHQEVEHNSPTEYAIVATHILEILTSSTDPMLAVRSFLESYREKPFVPPGMAILSWPRSPLFQEYFEWLRDLHGVPERIETPTPEWAAIPDEEFFEDSHESRERLERVTREAARDARASSANALLLAELENERLRQLLTEHGIDFDQKKRARPT